MSNIDVNTAVFFVNLMLICVLYYWTIKPLRVLWFRMCILDLHKTLHVRSRELGISEDSIECRNRFRFYNYLYEEYYRDLNTTLLGIIVHFIRRAFKKSESRRETDESYNQNLEGLNNDQEEFMDRHDTRFFIYFMVMMITSSVPLMAAVGITFLFMISLYLLASLITRVEFLSRTIRLVHRLVRSLATIKEIPHSYDIRVPRSLSR